VPLYELALVGSAQGLMLVLVLASNRHGNLRANRLLAAFIGLLSLRLLLIALEYRAGAALSESRELFQLLHLSYAIGPLLFAYTLQLTAPSWRLRAVHLWHLVPIPIAGLLLFPGGLVIPAAVIHYQQFDQLPESLQHQAYLASMPLFLSVGLYAAASIRCLGRYRYKLHNEFSSLEWITLSWLRVLAWSCLAIGTGSLLLEAGRIALGWDLGPRVGWSVLFSVALIYYMGLMGLRQPLIFDQGRRQLAGAPDAGFTAESVVMDVDSETRGEADHGESAKYRHSGLSDTHVDRLWSRLGQLMAEQQPYLQPGLKLAQLAQQLGTRPNYLSQVINSCAGESFFDYINRHRVSYASERLLEATGLTIAEIALEAGFSSQNIFNKHFRKYAGCTPSQYRSRLLGSDHR
jgi:AraC-like DNA-binding protein/uncharacterized membrane protein